MEDSTAPTLSSTQPAADATDVAPNTPLQVTFSEPMLPSTVLVELFPSVPLGSPSWNADATIVTYTPQEPLLLGTTYTATVTGKDVAGNSLAEGTTFGFTVVPDTTAPNITSTSPSHGDTDVDPTAPVIITFSELMDVGTVSVTVASGGGHPAHLGRGRHQRHRDSPGGRPGLRDGVLGGGRRQ